MISKVNEMRMPTWRSSGLNFVEYNPSIDLKKKYNLLASDAKGDLDNEFSSKSYGLSKELLKENEEYRNLNIYLEDSKTINLVTDNENNQLVSKIDIKAKAGNKNYYLINFFSKDRSENLMINSLIRIVVEKNAKAKLVVITNVGENSTSLQSIASIIDDDASLDISYIELGCEKSYVNIKNHLQGDKSVLIEDGVYFKEEDEFLDILAVNEHRGEDTDSRAMFNGALKDRAIKNWKGIVDLRTGANHADGKIGDYSMMLSSDAINKSAPVLLNEVKEVSGNHAASVGRLNKEMLFYIMSRGFNKKQAQALMLEANFAPTLDKIEDEKLRDELKNKVHYMNTRN